MGSLAAFLDAAGEDFLPNLLTIILGVDGLLPLLLGSVGDLIGTMNG